MHYAQAWDELKAAGRAARDPGDHVSLEGKSSFPENHPLALGSGGAANAVRRSASTWQDADVIFGIGCSFATTGFGIQFPTEGKTYIHSTLDASDINKDVPSQHGSSATPS